MYGRIMARDDGAGKLRGSVDAACALCYTGGNHGDPNRLGLAQLPGISYII